MAQRNNVGTASTTNLQTVCDNHNNDESSTSVPRFIRLFVIRRVICVSNCDNETNIRHLVNKHLKHHEMTVKLQAYNILLHLITDGIKQYMSKWYDDNNDKCIIEMIFDQIVLIKFAKEYNTLITYNSNNNSVIFSNNCKDNNMKCQFSALFYFILFYSQNK